METQPNTQRNGTTRKTRKRVAVSVRCNVVVEGDVFEAMQRIAHLEYRTVPQVIRMALRAYAEQKKVFSLGLEAIPADPSSLTAEAELQTSAEAGSR